LKIFLSFLQSPVKHPVPAYDFWEFYIKNGIQEAGHTYGECPDVDWALGLVQQTSESYQQWKEQAWSKTIDWLKKHPADMFLSYLYPAMVDEGAIAQIKKMGIPCVNFFCDNVREFQKAPVEFDVFDLNWVPEYKAVKLYQKAGYPCINLPMPIWIAPKLRVVQEENNSQVAFIGSKDIQRQLFFEDVTAKKPALPLAIYGSGWSADAGGEVAASEGYTTAKKVAYQYKFLKDHAVRPYLRKLSQRKITTAITAALKLKIQGTISFEAYNDLTAKSLITVGVNRYPSFNYPLAKPNTYSRLRDIEAPMLGACYLTEWTEGLDELYSIGVDIETYVDADSFIEKVAVLTADEKKRKMLRINGQKKALQNHGIPQSLTRIIKRLN